MEPYRHTQIGYVIIGSLSAGILMVFALMFNQGRNGILISTLFMLAIGIVLFASLTVEVKNGTLKSHFGPGLIRKSIPLAEVEACRVVRNPWYYGWGIHWTPDGWLYNVSGTGAVEITLRGGGKFRLGTDEPEALCQAIRRSLAEHSAGSSGRSGLVKSERMDRAVEPLD